ncbi:MAG: tape measure protein, partial [Xenococcus sp. (in: cyanobacteria)]
MATRTLGIKYEVKGYEKASASLKNLRLGIRKNQELDRESTKEKIKNSNQVAKVEQENQVKIEAEKKSSGNIAISQKEEKLIVEKTIKLERDNINFDYYGNSLESLALARKRNYRGAAMHYARPRYNSIQGGFYGGIGGELGRRFTGNLINGVRGIFGLKAANDEVDISNESAIKIGIAVSSRMKNVGIDSNSLEFLARPLHQKLSWDFQPNGGLFGRIIDQVMMPIKTVQYSFYEGIGSHFGNQYATGLSNVLAEDLDFSMERRGMVTGKGVSHLATEGMENVIDNIKEVRDEYQSLTNSQSLEKFTKFLKSITKMVATIPTEFNTGTRRGAVDIEGMRQLNNQLGDLDLSEVADLSDKDQVVFTVGGFAAAEGKSGFRMAEEIQKHADEKTEVIGADNSFTDLKFSVFGNKALWGANLLGKVGQMNVKGFNPDSVKLAAQVIALLEKNPNLKATITGHSAGGFVVEEVQRLLENMGYADRIKTIATGTPTTRGGLNQENTRQLIGDNDDIVKGAEEAGSYLGITRERNPEDELEGVASHYGEDYLTSESYLRAILGEGFDSEKSDARRSELQQANSQFQGKLIELETLYLQYVSQLYQMADDLIEEVDIRPDRLIAKARRHKLRERGLEKVGEKISTQEVERLNVRDQTETAVLVIGGFSGAEGRSGESFAAKLGQIQEDDKTQFIGVRNEYTDIFKREEIGNISTEDSIKRILALFADIHQLGYNPDAVNIAAQAIDMQEQRPDVNIKIAGYSGGGYVAEDVIELLKAYGADMSKIDVIGIGTPQLPGGIKNREFNKLLGEQDNIMEANELKNVNNRIKDILGFDIFPELMQERQNIEGIDSHSLNDYVSNSEEVKNFLFGNDENSRNILEAYGSITEKNKEIEQLGQKMEQIQADETLNQSQKVEQLLEIRRQYVRYLQEIARLSREAKKIGGGRFFSKQHKFARGELAEVGIHIDPLPKKKKKNQQQETQQETQSQNEQTPPDPWDDNESEAQRILEEYKTEYRQYLDSLVADAKADSAEIINALVPDFSALPVEDRKRYFKAIRKDIEELANFYRESIAEGDLETAREIGELLLTRIQAVREVYEQLKTEGETDSVLAGNLAQVTSIETEIRQGQPNLSDRLDQGLEDYFDEQVEGFFNAGENVTEGFVQGILNDLEAVREASREIGEEAQDSLEDELGIESPSTVFEKIAYWTVQGYVRGLDSFNQIREQIGQYSSGIADRFEEGSNRVSEIGTDLQERLAQIAEHFGLNLQEVEEVANNLENRGREIVENTSQISDTDNSNNNSSIPEADTIASFLDTSGQQIVQQIGGIIFGASQNSSFDQILDTVGSLLGKLFRIFLTFKLIKSVFATLGIGKIVEGFTNLREASLEAAMGTEVLDKRIRDLSGSAEKGAENLAFVRKEAQRLNLDLVTAKENYSQILKGTRGSALEGVQSELIFTAFSQKANDSGISNAERTRLFEAVRQIIGKRFLSQEEVRQQIGELLGDFEAQLATSLGVSIPTLGNMIESRQVTAEDALPKVAAQMMAASGLSTGQETARAALIQVDNSINQFREKVGFALQPIQKFGFKKVTGFFNWLTKQIDWIQQILAGGLTTLFIYLVTWKTFVQVVQKALLGLIKILLSFKKAIGRFLLEMVLVQIAINTWLNVLKLANNSYPETQKNIETMTLALEKMREAYDRLADSGDKFNKTTPSNKKWELNEGWQLPDNVFG